MRGLNLQFIQTVTQTVCEKGGLFSQMILCNDSEQWNLCAFSKWQERQARLFLLLLIEQLSAGSHHI